MADDINIPSPEEKKVKVPGVFSPEGRKNSPEAYKAARRTWYQVNLEKEKARQKASRKANMAKVLLGNRKWAKKNREKNSAKINAGLRAWRAANAERYRAICLKTRTKNAVKIKIKARRYRKENINSIRE